jgi:hypothetical protein
VYVFFRFSSSILFLLLLIRDFSSMFFFLWKQVNPKGRIDLATVVTFCALVMFDELIGASGSLIARACRYGSIGPQRGAVRRPSLIRRGLIRMGRHSRSS